MVQAARYPLKVAKSQVRAAKSCKECEEELWQRSMEGAILEGQGMQILFSFEYLVQKPDRPTLHRRMSMREMYVISVTELPLMKPQATGRIISSVKQKLPSSRRWIVPVDDSKNTRSVLLLSSVQKKRTPSDDQVPPTNVRSQLLQDRIQEITDPNQ